MKSLYLFQNFVFYIIPNLQVNSIASFIDVENPPFPKVIQLVVY